MAANNESSGNVLSFRSAVSKARASQKEKVSLEGQRPADGVTLNLVEALRSLAVEMLEQRLGRLFEGADDALFEMARKATNNREQSHYLDAMRAVRLSRSKLQQLCIDEFRRLFPGSVAPKTPAPPADLDIDTLSLQESNTLEKSIAISNIVTKADEVFKKQLWDIGRRLNTLIRERNAPISPQALSPVSFCEAFGVAADSLNLEIPLTLVLYKLFDRLVITDLGDVYAKLLKFLDDNGVRPEKIVTASGSSGVGAEPNFGPPPDLESPASPPPPGSPFAAPGSGPMHTPGMRGSPRLDPHTFGMLEQFGPIPTASASAPQHGYTDRHLANDLLSAAMGRLVPGWEPTHAWAYVQRTGAVGQMFNEILSDPNLPNQLKPRFDQLRFSVIKTALQDVSFFANPKHPVRSLVNELAELAATARATSLDALQRIEQLVGQIQTQFEVAADQVRKPRIDPLEHVDIEHFLEEQLQKNKDRRKAIIEKARQVVAEELQLRCTGRRIPESAWPLLKSGWAPMIAASLLRQGLDSKPWRDGLRLLDRILDTLDPRVRSPNLANEAAALCVEITNRFRETGLVEERIRELIDGFRTAFNETATREPETAPETASSAATSSDEGLLTAADAAAAAESLAACTDEAVAVPTAAVTELETAATESAPSPEAAAAPASLNINDMLEALIKPGSWFRVVDAATGLNRWLKAIAHYPEHSVIALAEFNGQNSLFLKLQQFLDGLVDNRIEPLDPMPLAKHLLDSYLQIRKIEAALAATAS